MEINIINEMENKPVNRKEINFEVVYKQAPPTRNGVKKELATKANVDSNLTIVRKMSNVFGERKMLCNAHVYPDKKTLEKYEPKHIIKRMEKQAEENAEKAKEEVIEEKEEVVSEEPKEEVKEEPKEDIEEKVKEEVEKSGEE